MEDSELLFLLNAPQPDWERIEQLFQQRFPLVPVQLVQRLGEHYLLEPADDLAGGHPPREACLRAYQAYGFATGSKQAAWGSAQRKLPDQGPPFPAPLLWSAAALMQVDAAASLEPPVIHAWVYEEGDQPVEVVICGRGVGWVKEQIDTAVLGATFNIQYKVNDILVEGLSRLSLDKREKAAPLANDPLILEILRKGQESLSATGDVSPAAAMSILVQELSQLEQRTGLVKVVRRSYVRRAEFIQSIDDKKFEHIEAADNDNALTIWQYNGQESERLVIPYALPELNLCFPMALTRSAAYQRVHDHYQNQLVRTAVADALRRLNFYASELSDHVKSLEQYANPQARELLPLRVFLNIHLDYEVGLSYQLREPEEVSRDEYYGRRVPQLVKLDITWTRQMKRLLHNLAKAVGQPESNLNRLTMTRLFDAALRNQPLAGDAELDQAFQAWKASIQPYLWLLWRKALQKNGLNDEALSTRQLFFNLTIDLDRQEITMRPFYLVDTHTSQMVFDPQYCLPALSSIYDHLEQKPRPSATGQALRQFQAWQEQVQAHKPAENVRSTLRSALALDPASVMKEIVKAYRQPPIVASDYDNLIASTMQKVGPVLYYSLALNLWNHNAVHSACAVLEQAYQQVEQAPKGSLIQSLPDIPMTLAWLKAIQHFAANAAEQLRYLYDGSPRNEAERSIQRLIYRARQRDAAYVQKWLEKKEIIHSKAWRQVCTLSHLTDDERLLLNTLRALAFVQSAHEFAAGRAKFDPAGESPRSLYAKIGPAIEAIWTSPFIDGTSDQLEELVNLLLGEQVS